MSKQLKVLVLVGIPASGKSTWAKEFISQNVGWIRVSRDDYRLMLKNQQFCEPNIEKLVTQLVNSTINESLNNGLNVIIDNTNVQAKYINEFVNLVKFKADINYKIFPISLADAIERDKNRQAKVGEKVINKMYEDYLHVVKNYDFTPIKKQIKFYKEPVHDKKKEDIIVFDIDGTVAHFQNHRGPFDWNKVDKDDVDKVVADQVKLHMKNGDKIFFVSGRDDTCRDLTANWLASHGLKYEKLLMRKAGDNRKDSIIKKEIYENEIFPKYNVKVVYDDRNQVVKQLRSMGLKVFQVADGDF